MTYDNRGFVDAKGSVGDTVVALGCGVLRHGGRCIHSVSLVSDLVSQSILVVLSFSHSQRNASPVVEYRHTPKEN
jgi:hypothetical protein